MNYLQWLTQHTATKFWHDSAIPSEIDAAITNGAMGVTTNPVLTYKTLQAVPEFWQPLVDKIPRDLTPAEHAEALLQMVATYAAGKFRNVFEETNGQHGYALGQLDPNICNDSEKMIAQGLRYASWADNISVKTPNHFKHPQFSQHCRWWRNWPPEASLYAQPLIFLYHKLWLWQMPI